MSSTTLRNEGHLSVLVDGPPIKLFGNEEVIFPQTQVRISAINVDILPFDACTAHLYLVHCLHVEEQQCPAHLDQRRFRAAIGAEHWQGTLYFYESAELGAVIFYE